MPDIPKPLTAEEQVWYDKLLRRFPLAKPRNLRTCARQLAAGHENPHYLREKVGRVGGWEAASDYHKPVYTPPRATRPRIYPSELQ